MECAGACDLDSNSRSQARLSSVFPPTEKTSASAVPFSQSQQIHEYATSALKSKIYCLRQFESKPAYLPNLSLTQSLSGSLGELFCGSCLIGLVSGALEAGAGKGVVAGIGFAGLGEEVAVVGDVE